MILVSLCFIIGILIENKASLSLAVLSGITLISVMLTMIFRQAYLFLLLVLISGSIRVAISEHVPDSHLSRFKAILESSCEVVAVVQDIGESRKGTPKFTLQPILLGQTRITGGSILLYSRDIKEELHPGDTLFAHLELNLPRGKRNPHDFDYRDYLRSKNIYYESFLDTSVSVRIATVISRSITFLMVELKQRISDHFHTYLNPRAAGILSALILGEKSEVDELTRSNFANTGVIHVLAVSGLHVGYVSIILVTIFGILRFPYAIRMVCVVGGLIFYVGLTGGAPSVMRASIMAALMIFGSLLERKADILNILAAAAFIILLISPSQLLNLGFQLSFLAVLSIVTLFPIFKEWVSHTTILGNTRFARLVSPVLDLFLVSLAAQIGTLPLTVLYFNKIPIISLLANLVVVPLVGVIVATGMSLLILGSLSTFLATLWAATLEATIDIMLWFVQQCAQLDWAFVTTRSIDHFELILLLLGIFALAVVSFRSVIKLWLILILTWSGINIWQDLLKPPQLEIIVMDVGQGDGILIHGPNDKTIVVDAGLRFGGRDMGRDVIVPYLRYRNWKKIDLLVLTHPHNDHMGGAQYLLENMPVDRVLMPDIEYDSYGYKMLKQSLANAGIPVSSPFVGYMDSTLRPIYFRLMGPKLYDAATRPSNVNNTSLIMQMFYGNTTLLLTGDGEEAVEEDQLVFGNLLRSDLIKAPHHGSKTSSIQDYIDLVQPSYCLISVGEKNKFRHPSNITLGKYSDLGAQICRTDLEGALIFTSDGFSWSKNEWRPEK